MGWFDKLKPKRFRKPSKSYYIELKGIVQQDDGNIRIELDWDDNFIKHLRKTGYNGVDDDAIIQKYIVELTKSISSDMKGDSPEFE